MEQRERTPSPSQKHKTQSGSQWGHRNKLYSSTPTSDNNKHMKKRKGRGKPNPIIQLSNTYPCTLGKGYGYQAMPKMMTNKFRNIIFTLSLRWLSMHSGRPIFFLLLGEGSFFVPSPCSLCVLIGSQRCVFFFLSSFFFVFSLEEHPSPTQQEMETIRRGAYKLPTRGGTFANQRCVFSFFFPFFSFFISFLFSFSLFFPYF